MGFFYNRPPARAGKLPLTTICRWMTRQEVSKSFDYFFDLFLLLLARLGLVS
jgi:hypothetical protein